MGQTIAEKILAAHADGEAVRPGEFVFARVDLVLAGDITGPPTITQCRRMEATCVFDPDQVAPVSDHFTPPKDIYAAALLSALRAYARKQAMTHAWRMGEVEIEHTLLPEEGLIWPAAEPIPNGATVRTGRGRRLTTCGEQAFFAEPCPAFLQRLVASGGLVPFVCERLTQRRGGPAQ